MKTIELKQGNKTIIKAVPDDWKEEMVPDRQHGDLTTGAIKSLNMGMTPEQHKRIFGKEEEE